MAPAPWSREWETYCLRPLDRDLVREVDRRVDDIAACVAGSGADRLIHPRLESPQDRKLHAVSVGVSRYCGIDETGAITCCGVRGAERPQGTFVGLSLNDSYACAIRSSGELACWGHAASAAPPDGHFARVATGSGSCAISDKGSLVCWGTHSSWGSPPQGTFVDLALTLNDAYAVAVDGTVVTWGSHPGRRSSGATRVVANECQVCTITRAGMVECTDKTGQSLSPVGPFAAYAPGCPGGCGLRKDGSLVCDGPSTAPPPAAAAGRYAGIASTEGRFCATSLEGRVMCWGTPWPGEWLGQGIVTWQPHQ